MLSSSRSIVVAPSWRPLIVRVATRIRSTRSRPRAARPTARTILLTSTGSSVPSRLRTRIVLARPHGVSSVGAGGGLGGGAGGTLNDGHGSVLPGRVSAR